MPRSPPKPYQQRRRPSTEIFTDKAAKGPQQRAIGWRQIPANRSATPEPAQQIDNEIAGW